MPFAEGTIRLDRNLACECVGPECTQVRFARDAIDLDTDILAITGRADRALASSRGGTLQFRRDGNNLNWSISDDVAGSEVARELSEVAAAGVSVYGRPIVNQELSDFTKEGTVMNFRRASVRALLLKPILGEEARDGWRPARFDTGEERMIHEERYFELRQTDEGILEGTVMRYGDRARMGSFTESFVPGSLKFSDVIVNLQHDRGKPVARTGAGLELRDDGKSLTARIKLPDTAPAREARELVQAGILRGMSVEFTALDEDWNEQHRTVKSALMAGFALVDRPAYTESALSLRFEQMRLETKKPKARRFGL